MSTTPTPTEADLLAQFQADLTNRPTDGSPPPLPQGEPPPPAGPTAEQYAQLQAQVAQLQGVIQGAQQFGRQAPVEPREPAAPPTPPPGRRGKMTVEQWAERMKVDPAATIKASFEESLGLPEGMSFDQVLVGLAQQQQALEARNKALEGHMTKMQQETSIREQVREAESWRDRHEDYDPAWWSHIEQRVVRNGLPLTAAGYEAGYLMAVRDGVITTKATTGAPAAPQPPRMPSLRPGATGAGTSDVPDLQALYKQLDNLPQHEAFAKIEEWKRRFPGS